MAELAISRNIYSLKPATLHFMESEALNEENWLEIKNLDVYYDKKRVISQLNLKLNLLENTVIIGQNGSGKSTLIKVITKLKYPRYSQNSFINLFGSNSINIWKLRSKIGFVLTDLESRIKHNMTLKEVILSGYKGTIGLINHKNITREQIIETERLSALFDLEDSSKFFNELSDGQKKKALIARAIINKPKVLILDEPTCMLDVKANYELLEILNKLAKSGITLLYVTNTIESIIEETKRVILFDSGNILKDGSPKEVLTSENLSSLYKYKLSVKHIEGYWRTIPG